jgi:cytochrome c556
MMLNFLEFSPLCDFIGSAKPANMPLVNKRRPQFAVQITWRGSMKWRAIAAAAVLAGAVFGSVGAAEGTHDSRIAMMKKIGGAAGVLGAIAKGTKPFDADAVKAALTTIAETAKVFPDEFGPNADKADKEVNPKLWDNFDDFKAKAAKLSSDAETALATLPVDQAGVGAALKTIGSNCSACHQAYRITKN